ncbi:MAG TPA: hypothetical protein VMT58_09035, partial [Candidatus Binataceae bacterium]|nr:hypothetical protein [Candidatus Binataceae bacterium]
TIGADSRGSSGAFVFPNKMKKLHRKDGWLVALAGADLYQEFCAGFPAFDRVEVFRDFLIEFVKQNGRTPIADIGEPDAWNLSVVVGRRGELFVITGNGSIWKPAWGFVAIGSGQDYAYGAARVLVGQGVVHGMQIVNTALEVACEFCTNCGGPLDVAVAE